MSVNIVSFLLFQEALIDEKWLFRGINVMIWSAIAHFAYYVLDELSTVLGINVFTVIPKDANPQESASKSPKVIDSSSKQAKLKSN